MVTHSSTSRPVQCLCMAERTGCPVFTDLWSYVLILEYLQPILTKSIAYEKAPEVTRTPSPSGLVNSRKHSTASRELVLYIRSPQDPAL